MKIGTNIGTVRLGLAAALLALASCGGGAARTKSLAEPRREVPEYGYRVVAAYPHAETSYTQGLFYSDGCLWEGTGQLGESRLLRVELGTGRGEVVASLPASEFGEGIARVGDELFQLTWQSNKAYVYDIRTGRLLREHRYAGEGWGITTDGERLYMSDGSASVTVLDPATFKRLRRFTVTLDGEPVRLLNELEWIDGRIWANVYTSDKIVVIDPRTGAVERIVDLEGLLPAEKIGERTDVLNGIAWDQATGRIFVTGKNWPELYQIEIVER